jgi:multidrug efflux system outer membrane protein
MMPGTERPHDERARATGPRRSGKRLRGAVAAAGLFALAGACTVGPTPHRPESVVDEASRFANAAPEQEAPAASIGRWWESFDDPVTSRLVERAIAHNTDLRAAAGRVMAARGALRVATGQRLPQIDAALNTDRSQTNFKFDGDRFTVQSTTIRLRGSVAWQADLFGKLRRSEQAAWYQLLATEASREALLHSVVAEVVRTRAQIATLERSLGVARDRVASFERTLELIRQRFEHDLASRLELEAARENLEQSRSRIPELRYRLQQARHALDVLVGRRPGSSEELARTWADLPPTSPPPVGVPASLLDRRPDLRDSELRARARQAEVGVAIADLFPDLTIRGGYGFQSSSFADLIVPESEIWSFLTDTAARLFHGGSLRGRVDAAKGKAQAAAAEYAGEVLDALREVEDALVRERTARQRHEHVRERLSSSREAEQVAQLRYERGIQSLLDLLEVRRRRYAAEQELLDVRQILWNARVDLYLAIGGDWSAPASGNEEPTA